MGATRRWRRRAGATSIYKGNDNYYLEASSANGNRPVGGAIIGGSQTQAFGTAPLAVDSLGVPGRDVRRVDVALLRQRRPGLERRPHGQRSSTSTNPLQIGSDSIYGQYFNGLIDEVRIYNTALSAAQIQTDMTTPVEPSTPPPPDTTPPTNPSALTATAAGTTVNLSWTGSTDAGGVTGYEIERCQGAGCTNFTPLKTVTDHHDQRHRPHRQHHLQLPRPRQGRHPQLQRLQQHRHRHHRRRADTTPPTEPSALTRDARPGRR